MLGALLWPLAAELDATGLRSTRIWLSIGIGALCVFAGVSLHLLIGGGNRLTLAATPFCLALALHSWHRFRRGRSSTPARDGKALPVFLAAAGLLLAAWALRFPLFHYDGLLYHLPSAALAWQERSFLVSTAHPQIAANPLLPELLKIWAFGLAGDDSLAVAQQIPFAAGLAAIAFAFARQLRARSRYCLLAAVSVFLVPKVFDQAVSPNVDLIAAFWGAACALLLANRSPRCAAVALLCYAQLKYTSFLPALAGALILFAHLWKVHKPQALAWGVLFLALGGLWEWRNLFLHGKPTHPYQILAGANLAEAARAIAPAWLVETERKDPKKWEGYYVNGIEVAAGIAPAGTFPVRYWRAWGDSLAAPYDSHSGRWGPVWFLWALPSLVLFLALRLRRQRSAATAIGLALLFFALTVKSWEARFGLILLPFGFATMAWQLSLLGRQPRIGLAVLLLVGLSLAWSGAQITQSHPNPRPLHSAGDDGPGEGLYLATASLDAAGAAELSRNLDRLSPGSLWIDFTHGQRHEYGLPDTLLYPYFSRRWNRLVQIRSSDALGLEEARAEIRRGSPDSVLLQAGSGLGSPDMEKLGYRLVFGNNLGVIYARL